MLWTGGGAGTETPLAAFIMLLTEYSTGSTSHVSIPTMELDMLAGTPYLVEAWTQGASTGTGNANFRLAFSSSVTAGTAVGISQPISAKSAPTSGGVGMTQPTGDSLDDSPVDVIVYSATTADKDANAAGGHVWAIMLPTVSGQVVLQIRATGTATAYAFPGTSLKVTPV